MIAIQMLAREHTKEECIVYIALGIWGAYAAILPAVYRRAVEKGLGQIINLFGN